MAEPHRKSRRQPISRHPLFPAIVALWFAVLLGFGSFALRPSALEAIVLASHVDALIPAATPPLGATARLLLALVLGLFGGRIGFWLAKRAAAARPKPAPQVLRMAEVDVDDALPWPGMAEAPAPALDPGSLAPEPVERAPEPAIEIEAGPEPIQAPAAPPPLTAAERIAAAELSSLSHVELVERLAIAIQRRQAQIGAVDGQSEGGDQVVRFPGLADRQVTRHAPPVPAPRPAPQQTEKALRDALAALQRMSGGA